MRSSTNQATIAITTSTITAIGTPATVEPTMLRKTEEVIGIGFGASAASAPAAKMNVTSVDDERR